MPAPPPAPLPGRRRLAAYALDGGFLCGPWLSMIGAALFLALMWPTAGMGGLAVMALLLAFSSVFSLAVVVLQAVLFIRRGRTLGMAVTGLVAAGGVRPLAFLTDPLLDPLALLIPVAIVGVGLNAIGSTGIVSEEVLSQARPVAVAIVPALHIGVNLALLLLPPRRTLIDRVFGVHVIQDGPPVSSPPAPRGKAYAVDILLAAGCALPAVTVIIDEMFLGAAVASGFELTILGTLELLLWRRTGATIGMRALGISSRTRP